MHWCQSAVQVGSAATAVTPPLVMTASQCGCICMRGWGGAEGRKAVHGDCTDKTLLLSICPVLLFSSLVFCTICNVSFETTLLLARLYFPSIRHIGEVVKQTMAAEQQMNPSNCSDVSSLLAGQEESVATFKGNEFFSYNLSQSPIQSSVDELTLSFRTLQRNGLLLHTGRSADYVNLSLRSGALWLVINLGSGAFEALVEPTSGKFNDNAWHHVRVTRNRRQVRRPPRPPLFLSRQKKRPLKPVRRAFKSGNWFLNNGGLTASRCQDVSCHVEVCFSGQQSVQTHLLAVWISLLDYK